MNKKCFGSSFKKLVKLTSILNIIDISTFIHVRFIKSGKYFIPCNNSELIKLFEVKDGIEYYFTDLIKRAVYGKISVTLWPLNGCEVFFEELNKINIQNGISISYCLGDYVDIFSFATNDPNEKIKNFYLNNLSLLKRFIIYFRIKAKDIIEEQLITAHPLKESIKFEGSVVNEQIENIRKFKKEIASCNFLPNLVNKKITLTKKESECLCYLLEGKSMRKISEELGIPQRTIEAYLENIKLKTGYYTKAQLLSAFLEDQTQILRIFYD